MAENARLTELPVEILYEILLYSLSSKLPLTCRHLYQVFKEAPPSILAIYVLHQYPRPTINDALKYPIMTIEVVHQFNRLHPQQKTGRIALPKRLFRDLDHLPPSQRDRNSHPLPYLRDLSVFAASISREIEYNSFDGYPLTRAVFANHLPLIDHLLSKGASPKAKNCFPIRVAIQKGDLALVKRLVEPPDSRDPSRPGKRVKLADRVTLTSELMDLASKRRAFDIVEWMFEEKGVLPRAGTLRRL
ncbi:hypothetical protein SISSUDRAFT_1064429 [Sistotremastrum suecicum HHB10207 ss-3]|uniref:Uncharacterized protein n=1 Tax=Sistotremastrum suecicum HHB10207 ss-3 TaxID=1314776 RepID=A0A166ANE4_9AGAM|nr:hypothetical protein SISSUDRAFT_1064429 [Sistotremastrum suecicum HHB10207 ss-3]